MLRGDGYKSTTTWRTTDEQERAANGQDACHQFPEPAQEVAEGQVASEAGQEKVINQVLRAVLDQYTLPLDGHHGVGHWARVLENGLRVAEVTGANVEVVQLFAILHDSRRVNESTDPDHGHRAADFATEVRGTMIELPDHEFRLLHRACAGHTHERTHPDITIQTCWDADRLDLGRVGIVPHPSYLCTDAAKSPAILNWAYGKSGFRVVPSFVKDEWGIELG